MVLDGEGTPSAASAPLPSVAAAPAPAPAAVARKGSKAIFDALAAVPLTSPPATEPPAPAPPAAEAPRKGSSILAGGAGAFFAAAANKTGESTPGRARRGSVRQNTLLAGRCGSTEAARPATSPPPPKLDGRARADSQLVSSNI